MNVDQSEGEADEAGIAAGGLVLAQDNPGVVFHTAEEVLDVAGPV